jgi:hypothetical protein
MVWWCGGAVVSLPGPAWATMNLVWWWVMWCCGIARSNVELGHQLARRSMGDDGPGVGWWVMWWCAGVVFRCQAWPPACQLPRDQQWTTMDLDDDKLGVCGGVVVNVVKWWCGWWVWCGCGGGADGVVSEGCRVDWCDCSCIKMLKLRWLLLHGWSSRCNEHN